MTTTTPHPRKQVTADRLLQLRKRWRGLNAALSDECMNRHYDRGHSQAREFRLSRLHARAHAAYFGAELAPTEIVPLVTLADAIHR